MGMVRFSKNAKLVHDAIIYDFDFKKAETLMETIENPLDLAFAKCAYLNFQLVTQDERFFDGLVDLEKLNKNLGDLFVKYYVHGLYCRYYSSMGPIRDIEKAIEHFTIATNIVQNWMGDDTWEKYVMLGHYYYTQSIFQVNVHNNYLEAPAIQQKGIDALLKVPDDGKMMATFSIVKLGDYHRDLGNFDEAVKQYFKALEIYQEYNTSFEWYPFRNLTWLYYTKGDLVKAEKYNKELKAIGLKFNNIHVKYESVLFSGHIDQRKGNYDDALDHYFECLEYANSIDDSWNFFVGYFEIFKLYYDRYRLTSEKKYLREATVVSHKLEELFKSNPENVYIKYYTKYVQAIILGNGSLRDKAKAINLLEVCVKNSPDDISMVLHLVDLLFEDAMISNDERSISQIEKLMEKMSMIPFVNNPKMIYFYISQQTMFAKYEYYIKGDIGLALEILDKAKSHIETFGLKNLVIEIDNEIFLLEKDARKWGAIDSSVKERIQSADFNKYVQEALKIANTQI